MVNKTFLFKNLSLIILIALCSFQPSAKNNEITLHDGRLSFTPKEYHIDKVIDNRAERNSIIPGNAIRSFIEHNLARNTALRPVVLHVKQLKLTERPAANGGVEGNIDLSLEFDLDKSAGGEVYLTAYKSNTVYTRKSGRVQDSEPALRQMLENALAAFDGWMNREADKNIILAKSVKVTFTDYKETPEKDSIYYAVNRPLTWADFKGKVPSSRFDAEVYATIGYNEKVEIIKGVVNVQLAVKACLPKSASWAKDGSKTPYALNHEQRHFDIAKIAAEKFKQKIAIQQMPVENYDGPINVAYLDAYREMTDMQKLYDDETHHGTNVPEQERWNRKIDEELKKAGVR